MLLASSFSIPLRNRLLFFLWGESLLADTGIYRQYVFVSIGRSSNGRTAAFEAVNLGSIPSLPAYFD